MKIDIKDLYPLQKELDLDIAKRHKITYKSTFKQRLLALVVELGEFANETRCFKYWSLKKSSAKEVVLEEYVDALHFLLSLGIPLKAKKTIYNICKKKEYNLTSAVLDSYLEALKLKENYCLAQYEKAFSAYFDIMAYLNVKPSEVRNAYLTKLKVNHERQVNKY